jgi:peptidoglycan/xylan/chitin deacetylase (PgdA/CDA1 family)
VNLSNIPVRLLSRYQRAVATRLYRRPVPMHNTEPLISFTFDDFPRSALTVGGEILERHGVRATYYASLGIMGKRDAAGLMFEEKDLAAVIERGHELGCHTYDHLDAWETTPDTFERSVLKNRAALERLLPETRFASLSYPKMPPRPATKRRVGPLFACCRCGNQKINQDVADANHLFAFFLEMSRGNFAAVQDLIAENARIKGWLIFATHDVCEDPSLYGCSPEFFEQVVRCSIESGARVLPVVKGWDRMSQHGLRTVQSARPAAEPVAV